MARPARKLPRGISVYQPYKDDDKPRYRVRIQFQGRQYSAGIYETLAEAREAQKHFRRQALLGTFVPSRERHRRWREEREAADLKKVTVRDYSAHWLADLRSGPSPRTATTLVAYDNTLEVHILPALGDQYLAEVSQSKVDALLGSVLTESGPAASRNVARTLRAMFNHAIKSKKGGITEAPFTVTVPKSPVKTSGEIPTPDEVSRISAHMPEELRLAPVLSAVCALRPAETLGLQRRDIVGLDGDAPHLNVQRQWIQKQQPPGYGPPKYGSSRVVGIPQVLAGQIRDHLDAFVGEAPDAPLFASKANASRPIGATTYRNKWVAAQKAAGVGPFVLHALRHLGLTLVAVVGGTNAEVMAFGGHRDAEAAARYQHSLRGRDRELTEALGAQWEGK